METTPRRTRIEQLSWTEKTGWQTHSSDKPGPDTQLALIFGSVSLLRDNQLHQQIEEFYPNAHLFGCSTAGEICGAQVRDDSLTVTALAFADTRVQTACATISDASESFQVGAMLARSLPTQDLAHVLALSDGLRVNGSDLVQGLTAALPSHVTVTGGLSADGPRFGETLVLCDAPARENTVAVVGLYGNRLKVGYGSLGGWDQFGPERLITRSKGNVLYELDGKSALGLYKLYLGEQAKDLPASGLLFPLGLRLAGRDEVVVRTILSVNEEEQSLTFAGDVPVGAFGRLMKANTDRLIDGAIGAAQTSHQALTGSQPDWALLISCVGRKLIMRQRVEEEVEGVREILGSQAVLCGFYSYGEISPFTPTARCDLHNQTMTITTFSEV